MTNKVTIGHTAVKVKDINGMVALMEELLGFTVRRSMGEGTPTNVWFQEGLQLVSDPEFDGPEGRMHHLGLLVEDMEALCGECRKRGFAEVRPNWFALPDGLVLEIQAS